MPTKLEIPNRSTVSTKLVSGYFKTFRYCIVVREVKNYYSVPMGISKPFYLFSGLLQIFTFDPKSQRVFVVDSKKVR